MRDKTTVIKTSENIYGYFTIHILRRQEGNPVR